MHNCEQRDEGGREREREKEMEHGVGRMRQLLHKRWRTKVFRLPPVCACTVAVPDGLFTEFFSLSLSFFLCCIRFEWSGSSLDMKVTTKRRENNQMNSRESDTDIQNPRARTENSPNQNKAGGEFFKQQQFLLHIYTYLLDKSLSLFFCYLFSRFRII